MSKFFLTLAIAVALFAASDAGETTPCTHPTCGCDNKKMEACMKATEKILNSGFLRSAKCFNWGPPIKRLTNAECQEVECNRIAAFAKCHFEAGNINFPFSPTNGCYYEHTDSYGKLRDRKKQCESMAASAKFGAKCENDPCTVEKKATPTTDPGKPKLNECCTCIKDKDECTRGGRLKCVWEPETLASFAQCKFARPSHTKKYFGDRKCKTKASNCIMENTADTETGVKWLFNGMDERSCLTPIDSGKSFKNCPIGQSYTYLSERLNTHLSTSELCKDDPKTPNRKCTFEQIAPGGKGVHGIPFTAGANECSATDVDACVQANKLMKPDAIDLGQGDLSDRKTCLAAGPCEYYRFMPEVDTDFSYLDVYKPGSFGDPPRRGGGSVATPMVSLFAVIAAMFYKLM